MDLKKEAEYFGDIVIVPYMDAYDLVVLKTVAICEYGVSAGARPNSLFISTYETWPICFTLEFVIFPLINDVIHCAKKQNTYCLMFLAVTGSYSGCKVYHEV